MTVELYSRLEQHLKTTLEPLSCTDLVDLANIREITDDANRVSDALGNLWRRGYLNRHYAAKILGSQARWAYTWKKTSPRPAPTKTDIRVSQTDDIVHIETEDFSIWVRSKIR